MGAALLDKAQTNQQKNYMENEMKKMFEFIAFYRGKQTVVQAATSYEAQLKAAAFFKAKKSYEVTVLRADVPVDPAAI